MPWRTFKELSGTAKAAAGRSSGHERQTESRTDEVAAANAADSPNNSEISLAERVHLPPEDA